MVYSVDDPYDGRLYHSSMNLDQQTSFAFQQLIDDFQILAIPSDCHIKEWKQGLDGITYATESKAKNSYSVKRYWTPTTQENIKEARFFQYFINEIYNLKTVKSAFVKFMDKQPFKSYYSGYGSATIATLIK